MTVEDAIQPAASDKAVPADTQTGKRPLWKRIFPSRRQIRENLGSLLLCLLSALGGAFIFHQDWLGLLGWLVLIPYLIAIHRLQGKMLAWGTVLFGFTWYYLNCWWLHTLVVFHWLIPVGVMAGALYYGLYFLLFAFPAAWCARHLAPVPRTLAIAVCWVAVEYLRSFTDMAFPWNLMGHSQFPFNSLHMPAAAVGGVYYISLMMAVANAALAVSIREIRQHQQFPAKAVAVAGVFITVMSVFGYYLGSPLVAETTVPKPLKVSVVQPGISQLAKWDAQMGQPDDTPETYQRRYFDMEALMQDRAQSLILEAGRQDSPDLVVLPESLFMGGYFTYQAPLHEGLWNVARQVDADLFFGADNRMERETYDKLAASGQRFLTAEDTPVTYTLPTIPTVVADNGTTQMLLNEEPPMASMVAAWHVSPERGLEPRVYNKMQLVPFGETVPFIGGFDWLRAKLEVSGIAGAFRPGIENTVFEVDGARFGAVICFESTFSYLTRRLSLAGAQFICVLTNDAWYDPGYAMGNGGFWGTLFKIPGLNQLASAGPKQHLIQSQLRAIETGLPVVRSANTGISALIDDTGRITESLPYGQSGFITGNIDIRPGASTLSVRFGEWVGLLCTGFWLAIILRTMAGRLRKVG